jgi:hypothetical protein
MVAKNTEYDDVAFTAWHLKNNAQIPETTSKPNSEQCIVKMKTHIIVRLFLINEILFFLQKF